MGVQTEIKKKNFLVTIDKEFSVDSIREIKMQIAEKLERVNSVKLLLKDIEKIDITAIQLVVALKKKLLVEEKEFSLEYKMEENALELLSKSGIISLFENK